MSCSRRLIRAICGLRSSCQYRGALRPQRGGRALGNDHADAHSGHVRAAQRVARANGSQASPPDSLSRSDR